MPVKLHPELVALREAAKAPRPGYFSVLDELIGQLPDRPISVEELRQRLKPGRMLQREDMKFPLKQEELDYALPELGQWGPELKQNPKQLRDFIRKRRPAFNMDDVHHEGKYSEYTTQGPNRIRTPDEYDEGYFATTTDSSDFGEHMGHYNDGTISFSRGSRHNLPGGGGVLRLIDEIQNDRANDARKHAHVLDESSGKWVEGPLRGWRTPDQQAELDKLTANAMGDRFELRRIEMEEPAAMAVPDTPFKTPQEYGRLEIKNQLLDALASDDAALGITPASGPASWFPGTGAKDTTYDKVYPGELRKIAKQYGAAFNDVALPVKTTDPFNLPTLQGADIVDFLHNLDWLGNVNPSNDVSRLLEELEPHYRVPRGYDERLGHTTPINEAYETLREMNDLLSNAQLDNHGKVSPQKMSEQDADDLLDLQKQLNEHIENAYNEALDQRRISHKDTLIRNIPSMHLSPEVKERIARIGLPLFTAAGAAMISPEMTQESDMGMVEQPQGFAKGGMARRATGALMGIREASERAAAARGQEREWLRELATKNAPRRPVGASPHGGVGEYGAWAEGPAKAPRSPTQDTPRGGALNTMRGYLKKYAEGGPVSLAEKYADAVEGEYEEGDEFLGEDDEYEYYACGGVVNMSLGGLLKKGLKKIGKMVVKDTIGKIPLVGGIASKAANKLLFGGKKSSGAQGVPGQMPASIGEIPDLMGMQQQAIATNAAAPTQLGMLQQRQQAQPRVVPGSNAGGLLGQIQQQQRQPYLPGPAV